MKNLSFNKGRPSCLYIFIFVLLLSNQIFADELTFRSYTKQLQQQITGTVTDALGPLPSVTVMVKGTTISTVTDQKGNFSITANSTDTLVFSFIGYSTQEILVGNKTSLNVILVEDSTQLKEVTINAGYYKVKDKERTGSIERITTKDIEIQPVTNVLATMQGRMAGVSITQSNGTPGSGFDIKIRGQNSLRFGANNPLYIIDGIPYSSEPIGTGSSSPILGGSANPLNSIVPEQIESVEVLKDADATAIYGSRGANGVILISTKKGKIGKTLFTANVASGLGQVTNFMKVMNTSQYIAMRQEAYSNEGLEIPDWEYDINGEWSPNRYTDWQKKLAGGTAHITNIDATLSGGSEQTQFIVTGSFNNQEGVYLRETGYKKGAFRLGVNHESVNKRFRGNFTAGYTLQNNDQPRADLLREALLTAPNAPEPLNPDGTLNWESNTFFNPLRLMEDKYSVKTNDLIAGGQLSYTFLPGIDVSTNFGYTSLNNSEYAILPSTRNIPSMGLGPSSSSATLSKHDRSSWIVEPQLSWTKELGRGILSVLVGSTFQSQTGTQYVHSGSNFASNSLIYNLASASTVRITMSEKNDYKYQAFFGRLNYSWDSKYFLNLTGRRDGSSRFGPGKQYANFGAIGAAWLFSSENFLKENRILNFGKLRFSYGTTGNDQIGNYQYLDTYTSSGIEYDGTIGLSPSRLFNPNFAWETNRKVEVALETGFFKDRIFATVAFYDNVSKNQLTGIPLPGTTGFTTIQDNLNAAVQNRGFEFTLRTENINTANLSWNTNFNISFSKNKLLEFPGLDSSTYASQYVIGQPLNIRKSYNLLGVDPQTGLYTFTDYNGDGIITPEADKKSIINMNPEYFGGIQNQIRYKRVTLNFLFQFVKQKNLSPELMFGLPGSASNQPLSVLDHWQQPGDIASHQMYADYTNSDAFTSYNNYAESDGAVVDASYIRLKNISLSYNIPDHIFKVAKCRLFIEGQNLLTFTSFKGNDPEFMAVGFLPPLKIITTGLQVTF